MSAMVGLGEPLPPGETHAVSVSLPKWDDIVDYEEGETLLLQKMKAGYPRFFIHPSVKRIHADRDNPRHRGCLIFPSLAVAERCREFVNRNKNKADLEVSVNSSLGAYVVYFPPSSEEACLVKQFWQHTGEGISSRHSEHLLSGRGPISFVENPIITIEKRLASLYGLNTANNCVYLFPSGMSAIYNIHRALLMLHGSQSQATAIQFGFPYLDTWKVLQKFSHDSLLLGHGNAEDMEKLEIILNRTDRKAILGVFLEVPSNPLLAIADLKRLKALSDKYLFPIVIDDTIGTVANLDLLDYCDVIVTSLTKFFSGGCNAMGGSIVLNPKSNRFLALYRFLKTDQSQIETDGIRYWLEDAAVIESGSRDFTRRMEIINRNTEELCDMLVKHHLIETVYYPKHFGRDKYEILRRSGSVGYGGLFSLVFKRPEDAIRFYNEINISKGPSLGANFSLCCPYTLLAHYAELEFAESFGISRYLLRFSIGIEPIEELKEEFSNALNI